MPRGGVPVPFVGGVYEPNSTIAEMIMRAGQQQAQGQREMFGGLANTIGQLGQIPAQMAEQKAMEARTKLEESRAKREEARIQQQDEATKAKAERDAKFSELLKQGEPDPKSVLDIYGPEDGLKLLQGLHAYRELDSKKGPEAVKSLPNLVRAMDAVSEPFRAELYPAIRQKVVATGLIPPDQASQFLPEQYDPARWPEISKMALSLEKPAEVKQDTRSLEARLAAAAPGSPEYQQILGTMKAQAGATRAPEKDNEPLVAIMGADGNPVLVPRSQAVGKRPASIREQGRPVTSGDAGRVAELDTSLDDVGKIRTVLAGGATGAAAKAGTMVPNVITEFTGIGAEAKATQATIDRVKQVIGKALEDGVLRKEDEAKYEKILPTIGDPPSVVKAKIDGLESAIKQRKQRTLDALSDAGYDISRFAQRGNAPSGPVKIKSIVKE